MLTEEDSTASFNKKIFGLIRKLHLGILELENAFLKFQKKNTHSLFRLYISAENV